MTEVYVVVTRTDGSVAHIAVQVKGRFPSIPEGGWAQGLGGFMVREASNENIEHDLARINSSWVSQGDPTMVSWRWLSDVEHEKFNQDRNYRGALEEKGGKIQHNMEKARRLHQNLLRHRGGEKLLILDREWVSASASGKTVEVKKIEQKRQKLLDLPNDPRIDTASTIIELKEIDFQPDEE